jgi:hypothetical protein
MSKAKKNTETITEFERQRNVNAKHKVQSARLHVLLDTLLTVEQEGESNSTNSMHPDDLRILKAWKAGRNTRNADRKKVNKAIHEFLVKNVKPRPRYLKSETPKKGYKLSVNAKGEPNISKDTGNKFYTKKILQRVETQKGSEYLYGRYSLLTTLRKHRTELLAMVK